jgi:hypothetical protein
MVAHPLGLGLALVRALALVSVFERFHWKMLVHRFHSFQGLFRVRF